VYDLWVAAYAEDLRVSQMVLLGVQTSPRQVDGDERIRQLIDADTWSAAG